MICTKIPYTFLCALCSFASLAQIRILPGTTFEVNAGTVITVMASTADTIKVDAGVQFLNNGKVFLSPLVMISEAPGFPVSGSGFEEFSNYYAGPLLSTDPGGLGLVLSTSVAPDSLNIKRYHNTLNNGGMNSVARSYQVVTGSSSALGASITLNYDGTELNGHNPSNLRLYQSSLGGTNWNVLSSIASVNNVQSAVPVDSFSQFSLFSFDFKIDSLNTNTFYYGDSIRIYYTLNGVLNQDNFLIFEFSDKTGDFSAPYTLDSIPALNGSGLLVKAVSSALDTGTQYRLRLRTNDIPLISNDNGSDITILDPLSTSIIETEVASKIIVYPNPTNSTFCLKGNGLKRVIVRDGFSRVIIEKGVNDARQIIIDINHLPSGVYMVEIEAEDGCFFRKVMKI